ncbi:MAG: Adenylate kinase [Microgenomates bacterium OLB22]|nr:MAG: Adenylate kinase [Microgenomates bacterium OLB22]
MRLSLLGIQGSGKTTQAKLLSNVLGIPHLSIGQLLRTFAEGDTAEAKQVKEAIDAGQLLSDEFTIRFVKQHLTGPDYANGFVIDGFPRTVGQAREFLDSLDYLIHIELDEKEALWRLAGRVEDRDDTSLSAVYERIKLFKEVTTPVIEVFRVANKLIQIDGTSSIESIHASILKALGATSA